MDFTKITDQKDSEMSLENDSRGISHAETDIEDASWATMGTAESSAVNSAESRKFAKKANTTIPQSSSNFRTFAVASGFTFEGMKNKVDECQTIADFEFLYLCPEFQSCIGRIEGAQLGKNRLTWAKHWAIKLSQQDPEALSLNSDRWVCLRLLYAMCDCWKPKAGGATPTVSDWDIVHKFKNVRVQRILYSCLAMDRANALYNMIDGPTNSLGMHWYSCKDMHVIPMWRAEFGDDRMNGPTINKRLTWLFDMQALGLEKEETLTYLMQPFRTPLAAFAND